MNPEEIAELKQLIEFLKENNIGEFDLERGDLKVRLKFAGAAQAADLSQMVHLAAAAQAAHSAGFQPSVVAPTHPAGAPASPAPRQRRQLPRLRRAMTKPACTS